MQQRGFRADDIDIIVDFGTLVRPGLYVLGIGMQTQRYETANDAYRLLDACGEARK